MTVTKRDYIVFALGNIWGSLFAALLVRYLLTR